MPPCWAAEAIPLKHRRMVRNPFLARGAMPPDGLGGTAPSVSSPSLGLAAPPRGRVGVDAIRAAILNSGSCVCWCIKVGTDD